MHRLNSPAIPMSFACVTGRLLSAGLVAAISVPLYYSSAEARTQTRTCKPTIAANAVCRAAERGVRCTWETAQRRAIARWRGKVRRLYPTWTRRLGYLWETSDRSRRVNCYSNPIEQGWTCTARARPCSPYSMGRMRRYPDLKKRHKRLRYRLRSISR